MKVLSKIAWIVLVGCLLTVVDVGRADSLPPQKQLRTYTLHNNPNSADISPDEQLVAIECTKTTVAADSDTKRIVEAVQIWNFREDRLVAEFPAVQTDVKPSETGHFNYPIHGARIVRFSSDGNIVVALIDQRIFVLRATDLAQLLTVSLDGPGVVTQNFHGFTTDSKTFVSSIELSPDGGTLAVFWASELTFGRIDLFELSSGRKTLSWETPEGWSGSTNGLHWHPNGKLLLIAIPNATSCQSSHYMADVFAFNVRTGAIEYELKTGIPAPRIAVTADSRVLAVDGGCIDARIEPKLRVFDLTSGKHLLNISAGGESIGYSVSASADGTRFLAFVAKVKRTFDWLDFVSDYETADRKFSVWNLTNYEGIVTSQNVPNTAHSELRLSAKGRWAVSEGKASLVYELPSRDSQNPSNSQENWRSSR